MKIDQIRRGVLILVLLGSVVGSVKNLLATRDVGLLLEDPVADWDARFVRLKQALPFVRGEIGYISDSNIAGIKYDGANDLGEYVLTQYAMAPVILIRGTDQEWNIGNLSGPAFKAWETTAHDAFDVTQYGGGIYLLHRKNP
jgi:hypothetical protein